MSALVDLTGQRFYRLFVIKRAPSEIVQACWFVVCDCGKEKVVRGDRLRSGRTKSCGCFSSEATSKRRFVHGMTNSATYLCWQNMLNRCRNKKVSGFKNYGARGISVCLRWRKFPMFLKDMGHRPAGLTIERIDNNKGYFPENCRWATYLEQARNTRKVHLITHNGQTHHRREWERRLGFTWGRIWSRLQLGWSIERALNTPRRIRT